MTGPVLVIGANGYLGSHLVRQLVADGHRVRAMVRAGANTVGIDDLDVQRFVGDDRRRGGLLLRRRHPRLAA